MVKAKTWAERITPRGNLVLIRCKVKGTILTADQTSPWTLSFFAEVVKIGPGMYNAVRGERIPIETNAGVALKVGDLVVVNPQAVFAPPEWKDERIGLIQDSEVWCHLLPEEEEDGVSPNSHSLRVLT